MSRVTSFIPAFSATSSTRAVAGKCPLGSQRRCRLSQRVLVAQIGARRHYCVPRAFFAADCLETLHTDVMLPQTLARIAAAIGPLRRLATRSSDGALFGKVRIHPAQMIRRRQRRHLSKAASWAQANALFCRSVVRRGLGDADIVYAFNAAAMELFEFARDSGRRCILDQTAFPWSINTSLLLEEHDMWQGWEDQPDDLDESGEMAAREAGEWDQADKIICGSQAVVDNIRAAGGPAEKCSVVKYPFPETTRDIANPIVDSPDGPIRILFLGTLQLRKGIQYFCEALEFARFDYEARAVGPVRISKSARDRVSAVADVIGSVPRSSIGMHLRWSDVVVLPTLSEGSANVCYEALVSGTPVITTAAAGSVVQHGVNGFIVSERDAFGLAQAMSRLAADRELLAAMKSVCRGIGIERSMARYTKQLVDATFS